MSSRSLADVIRWLEDAPDGTQLPARTVLNMIRDAAPSADEPVAVLEVSTAVATWSERLWTVAPDTRLTVANVAEAFNRPKSWVYRHTSAASGLPRIPHRKIDGELAFLAGEVREWMRAHEEIVVAPVKITPIDRARRA